MPFTVETSLPLPQTAVCLAQQLLAQQQHSLFPGTVWLTLQDTLHEELTMLGLHCAVQVNVAVAEAGPGAGLGLFAAWDVAQGGVLLSLPTDLAFSRKADGVMVSFSGAGTQQHEVYTQQSQGCTCICWLCSVLIPCTTAFLPAAGASSYLSTQLVLLCCCVDAALVLLLEFSCQPSIHSKCVQIGAVELNN
jgi:hypothetical protein